MRRHVAVVTAVLVAACAGHSAAPSSAAAPAAAPARPAGPPPDPTALRYAAGANRYRIETSQHTVQDMMGNTTTLNLNTVQLMSLNLTAQGESLGINATLDSMSIAAPPGDTTEAQVVSAANEGVRNLIGKSVTGTMSPMGNVGTLVPSDTATALGQLVAGLHEFFFVMPAPPLAPGRQWTDTVSATQSMGPINMTSHTVRTNHIVGWEDHGGVRALHIQTNGTYSVTGSGEANGQPLEMSGNGQVTVDRFVSAAGIYLGAVETDSSDINVNVVSMGMSIPVHRTQHSTITRLQ